ARGRLGMSGTSISSTFYGSMVNAKFRDHVRTRSDVATRNEVYCKFICHDFCCVILAHCELVVEGCFLGEDQQQEPEWDGMILSPRRGGWGCRRLSANRIGGEATNT